MAVRSGDLYGCEGLDFALASYKYYNLLTDCRMTWKIRLNIATPKIDTFFEFRAEVKFANTWHKTALSIPYCEVTQSRIRVFECSAMVTDGLHNLLLKEGQKR